MKDLLNKRLIFAEEFKFFKSLFMDGTEVESYGTTKLLVNLFDKLRNNSISEYEYTSLKVLLHQSFLMFETDADGYIDDTYYEENIKHRINFIKDEEYFLNSALSKFKNLYEKINEVFDEHIRNSWELNENIDIKTLPIIDWNSIDFSKVTHHSYINSYFSLIRVDGVIALIKFRNLKELVQLNDLAKGENSTQRISDVTQVGSFTNRIYPTLLTEVLMEGSDFFEKVSPIFEGVWSLKYSMYAINQLLTLYSHLNEEYLTKVIKDLEELKIEDDKLFEEIFTSKFHKNNEKLIKAKNSERFFEYLINIYSDEGLYNNYLFLKASDRSLSFLNEFVEIYIKEVSGGCKDLASAVLLVEAPFEYWSLYLKLIEEFNEKENQPMEWWLELNK